MHSYCRCEGSKFRKLSPIPNRAYLLQTYGVMSSAPWFLPLEIQDADTVQWSVEKSPTAVGDISINRWRYFQQPLNYSFVQGILPWMRYKDKPCRGRMQEIKPVYMATIARLWNNGYCALRPKAFLYFFACHHLHTPIYYISELSYVNSFSS